MIIAVVVVVPVVVVEWTMGRVERVNNRWVSFRIAVGVGAESEHRFMRLEGRRGVGWGGMREREREREEMGRALIGHRCEPRPKEPVPDGR